LEEAKRLGRPIQYLPSSKTDKKSLAEQIAARDGIEEGLICVLSCVEPCQSFDVGPNPEKKQLELKHRLRKCLFLYHYWKHPVFGFMSARIQTWFPFQVQIYLNGREWLAQQMKREGLPYVRHENCFPWIADYSRARRLMDDQLKTDWAKELGAMAQQLNPAHGEIFGEFPADYYWSAIESEWATDVGFQGGAELQRLFPFLVEHGMTSFSEWRCHEIPGPQSDLQGPGAWELPRRGGHGLEEPPGRGAGQTSGGSKLGEDVRQGAY
jgi:hypothetical protein